MNLRSINPVAATWKRINLQYVTLAAGLALAVAGAAAAGAFERGTSKAPAALVASQASTLATSGGRVTSIAAAAPAPQTIIYLVGSLAQADAIQTTADQDELTIASLGLPLPYIQRVFFLADSPATYDDAHQTLSQMIWDFWEVGMLDSLRVIDVREAS